MPDSGMFSGGPHIMGIVNVTPDSFSDGGLYNSVAAAVDHARRLVDEGADILDIGGESTRPGARPASVQEELDRVLPVIEALKGCPALISIDTRNARTMREAVAAGAGMINDVTALDGDSGSVTTVATLGVPVCLMHMQGTPETMQDKPIYNNVMRDVFDFLQKRIEICETAGIDRKLIVADPGIGFGKALPHNLILLQNVSEFLKLGVPLLVGASRKSFIAHICADSVNLADPVQRMPGSIAAALWCLQHGVQIFRVHDVAQTRQAFAVYEAIRSIA